MSAKDYQKWFTGTQILTNTINGATPPINESVPDRTAHWSSATITADGAVTHGAQSYADGDLMFFSDGNQIFNRTGNIMNGSSTTGGIKSLPQSVNIVKVPDTLADVAKIDKGRYYWVFSNALTSGIRVGLVDMSGDGGLGTFSNYTLSGQTPPGGTLGTLSGSQTGVGGRMATICRRTYKAPNPAYDSGFWIIAKSATSSSGTWTDNGWLTWQILAVNSTGWPIIDQSYSVPIVSAVGTNYTGWQDNGPHGVVDVTPLEISTTGVNNHKVATIYRPTVGTNDVPQLLDKVEVLSFDGTTGQLSNPTYQNTNGLDKGPRPWPASPGDDSRYYNMYAVWSHDSTATKGHLYYGNLDSSGAASPTLQIAWNEINSLNVWSVTNKGAIDINDNAGINIWEPNHNGRIIAGIWRDPQKSGRIFVSTPLKTGEWTLSVTFTSPTWSTHYPEIYSTNDTTTSNPIQHCIIENVNAPVTTAPTASMVGTLLDNTYYRYGAPQFTPCTYATSANPDLLIKKCNQGDMVYLDTDKGLWLVTNLVTTARVNKLADIGQLSAAGVIGLAHNQYTDNLYIWDSPTGGNSVSYLKWNSDNSTITNPQAIGGANLANWASIKAVSHVMWTGPASGGQTNPTTDLLCDTFQFVGLKAGETNIYSIGAIKTDTNEVSAWSAASQIDISSAFGGALAGKHPTAVATYSRVDVSLQLVYVAFGDRVAIYDTVAGAWTLCTNAAPGNITTITISRIGGTDKVQITTGALGSTVTHNGDVASGAAIVWAAFATSIVTDPGLFPWTSLPMSCSTANAAWYFENSPLRILGIDPDYAFYAGKCNDPNTDVWQLPATGEHRGCFFCYTSEIPTTHHVQPCDWQQPDTFYNTCRACLDVFQDRCIGFLPCCIEATTPTGGTYSLGPVEMPGIITNDLTTVVAGDVYSVSNGGTPVCGEATAPTEHFWFTSEDGNIYSIDNVLNGTCSISEFTTWNGVIGNLKDLTFDKHGNIIYTSGATDISWASAWPSYISDPELITNAFTVPQCLDYDYSATGHIVAGDMVGGNATFARYTNSLSGGIAIAGSVTNATISLGYDLSVDYNSGDYYVLGDNTGAGGLNKLMSIDDANGNHTVISDLATVCSFVAGQDAYGIERVRGLSIATSITYIISAKLVGIGNYELFLHTLNDAGTGQTAVIGLINPVTATNAWTNIPTGLGYNDICSKWPNNTDPSVTLYTDCVDCLSAPGTEDCCYKLTNCDTGVIQYSTQAILSPYIGLYVRLQGGTCWYVEKSPTCISPVSVILDTSPGPYSDCPTCTPDPTVYYKLPKCGDPTDVVYTVNGVGATSTPLIDAYFAAGVVVHLAGECFCREIQINPTGPQGTEAALTVSSTQVDCASCRYYLRVEDCVTGNITSVDYLNSPTLHPFIGAANAHDITIGGVAQDNCHKVLVGCLGPTTVVYPTGAITASYADCADCATSGQTCVKVAHCCGPSYVPDQIVNVTTGITAADVGSVVQADITVGGILYTGCWTVSASADCTGMLPDADVTAIATATVGTGNMPDCSYCLVNPCDPQCTLLESCTNPGTTITVSGGLGATIGTDVVELGGQIGCWKQCTSQGNPIAGTNWFYGDRLGIDFSTGAPVADFNGQSTMLNFNSSNAPNSDAYTFRGAAVHSATGAATIGGHAFAAGDLMFYTDGHWIYDRTHTKMNLDSGPVHEGNANQGATSSDGKTFPAQGAVIIPNAAGGVTDGVWHQYYVIQNSAGNGPIKWSIVDMTLNSGKGEVLAASDNTTLAASASEVMCVNTTTGIGSGAYWHFYYVPVMSNGADWANQHIKGIKFSSAGIGTAFVAVDVVTGRWNNSAASGTQTIGSGELLVNQTNDIIAVRFEGDDLNNVASETFAFGLNPVTGDSATAAIGWTFNNGYNGGANNGVFNSIVLGIHREKSPTLGAYVGDYFLDRVDSMAFSPNGRNLILSGTQYYDTNDPYNNTLIKSGFGIIILKLKGLAIEMAAQQAFVFYNETDDAAAFDAAGPNAAPFMWFTNSAGGYTDHVKSFPDASTASGWYGTPTDVTRCNVMINDLVVGPDGKLWLNIVEQLQDNPYMLKVGAGNQITNSLLRLDDPNNALAIEQGLELINPVPSYDIGNRPMGERFPTWLNMPCPCDPANVINPDPVITVTHNDCTDCAPPPNFCYKLTECECTGGTSGPANQCSVNDPATMPPNMVTYGKTWSPTCINNTPQRWAALVNAVQALGTQGAPGIAQTVDFSYSFINDGATFPIGIPGFGPALACEQGPGTANTTGISSWPFCAPYNKTYTITHVQFKAEMQTMFAEIKAMLEGVFNTNCGYGANLTVNFTDLGYETGYTAGDPAMGTNTITGNNGTSFTDSNGVAGIGDFRIGFSDFGALDPAGGSGCGNTGGASGILGLCFTGNLNFNDPGIAKASPEVGLLLFDANENWRKAGDAVVANSFSLIRVGIHEILHAFGYGHDWLTFGAANGCDSLCDCPCFQSDPTCPNLYQDNDNDGLPDNCPGAIYNADALMGPFSSSNSFATDFPTGLMGPEGIYDRRATCGIYGNPNVNFGCEDGVCLQGSGCTYITEYSDDPALAGYVGGIITWDNGDPAGERCWEVDIINPCPGGVALINPVNLVSGDPNGDCTDCGLVNPCYTLNLCSCNTVAGAPAQIITDTDLSLYCSGMIGTGTIVEIDLYPGACYEIDCTPQPCPSTGAVTVVVTNTYQNCTDCCVSNEQCYQLCPCDSTVSVGTCNGTDINTLTLVSPTPFAGATSSDQHMAASDFITTPGNGFDNVDFATLKYATVSSVQPCELFGFPGSGVNQGGVWGIQAIGAPNPFSQISYSNWTTLRNEAIALGITGVTVADNYTSLRTKFNAWFSGTTGNIVIGTNSCTCTFSGTDSCSTRTLISTANGVGYSNGYQQYSIDNPTDLHNTKKLVNSILPSQSSHCTDPITGNMIVSLSGLRIYKCGTNPNQPLDGMTNSYWGQTESWDTARAELVAAGYGNAAMDYNTMQTWLAQNYVSADGSLACFAINGGPCSCTSTCTVVTNDLSAELGQVVTLGGAPPAPLNTTECYEVQLCGTCGTGSCNPVGAVVLNTVHPTCPDCESGSGCPCYKLTDCSDPTIVINNVCQSADLDNAYINGEVININGNATICYEISCDDIINCDPATCLSVNVTQTYASCALCTGGQTAWECDPLGGCNCVPTAGPGFPSQAACLASPQCCPNTPSWDCDPLTQTCFDPGTGNGQYASVQACIQNCGTPESYNCIYSAATNSYSCSDPGDGSGTFATLANCNMAISMNTQPCYVESYNCVINNGVTQCIDPGDGTGTFNNTNGGLVACQGCNGCPLDPSCGGVSSSWDCDPVFGCIQNFQGTGQYPTLQDCALDCASYEPEGGTFESICENCLDEIDMKKFFDKVADVCDDCNVPFGLTDQEVTCDTGCFGNSNIYVFLDMTSTFGGSFLDRLSSMLDFKVNVIEPAFQMIKSNFPTYSGHLYVIPGAWAHGSQFGPCNNCNNTGAAAPGSATAPEDWLAWVNYPLSGNKGANGAGVNPMATGTLPANKRTVMAHTMVDGIGGAPADCNNPAYIAATHGPLLKQIMILPGSYATDGFNQVNPWQDPFGEEGFSDPYHEFEGGDLDSIVVVFQDESRGNPGGYHETNVGSSGNAWGGTCGNALWGGQPGLNWHEIGTGPNNTLMPQWKNDYDNYMSLHQYGWDANGDPNLTSHNVTQKTMIYAGSYIDHSVTNVVTTRRDFIFHLMGAVGAQSKDAIISYQGHIDCASYVDVPSVYNFQCYVATDVTIPNPYMGASGGGDPTHTTGYQGGSLSNYGMSFHIPSYPIQQLSSTMLYDLWKDYLSDC